MDNSSKVEMDYKQSSHYGETVMMKSPKTYGALGYLNPDIYNERHNDDKFKRLLDICIEENKTTLVVQHHKEFHTVEAMSLFCFYSCYISSSLEKTSRTCSK